jgi:hypothetical protein
LDELRRNFGDKSLKSVVQPYSWAHKTPVTVDYPADIAASMWSQKERNAALFDIGIVFSTSMPAIGSFVLLCPSPNL